MVGYVCRSEERCDIFGRLEQAGFSSWHPLWGLHLVLWLVLRCRRQRIVRQTFLVLWSAYFVWWTLWASRQGPWMLRCYQSLVWSCRDWLWDCSAVVQCSRLSCMPRLQRIFRLGTYWSWLFWRGTMLTWMVDCRWCWQCIHLGFWTSQYHCWTTSLFQW